MIIIPLPFIVFGVLLVKEIIHLSSIKFEMVLPLYLIGITVFSILFMRKSYVTTIITLSDNSFDISKLRNISYKEVTKSKAFTMRGFTTYVITLKEGKKIGISPTNNFTSAATNIFSNFISEFEKKLRS